MEVAAAEAERTDPTAPGRIIAAEPGPRGAVEIKGTGIDVQFRIWPVGLDGRQQHLVVQRQRRFDHAGGTRGRLGVADHGFDRSQCTAVAVGVDRAEDLLQGRKFDLVADTGAGAVGLDHGDRFRWDAGTAIGVAKGARLSFGAGCVYALGLAIAGSADPANGGIDAVAVTLGIGKAFEHQHTDAFTQHRTVRICGEWAGIARTGQNPGL